MEGEKGGFKVDNWRVTCNGREQTCGGFVRLVPGQFKIATRSVPRQSFPLRVCVCVSV